MSPLSCRFSWRSSAYVLNIPVREAQSVRQNSVLFSVKWEVGMVRLADEAGQEKHWLKRDIYFVIYAVIHCTIDIRFSMCLLLTMKFLKRTPLEISVVWYVKMIMGFLLCCVSSIYEVFMVWWLFTTAGRYNSWFQKKWRAHATCHIVSYC